MAFQRIRQALIFFSWSAGVLLLLTVMGFLAFVHSVRSQPANVTRADAIVVLTGGRNRITAAIGLLKTGVAERMLISGVHPETSRKALIALFPEERRWFICCVDIGRKAQDTIGNAQEIDQWARLRRLRNLIVVTSSYHMPRALTELRRVMPYTTLSPYPVSTPAVNLDEWWEHTGTTTLLLKEYAKLIPALARFGISRMLDERMVGPEPGSGRPPVGLS